MDLVGAAAVGGMLPWGGESAWGTGAGAARDSPTHDRAKTRFVGDSLIVSCVASVIRGGGTLACLTVGEVDNDART